MKYYLITSLFLLFLIGMVIWVVTSKSDEDNECDPCYVKKDDGSCDLCPTTICEDGSTPTCVSGVCTCPTPPLPSQCVCVSPPCMGDCSSIDNEPICKTAAGWGCQWD